MADERFAVSRFARGASCNSAVARYSEFIHYFMEVSERFYRPFENLFAELGTQENTFPQSQGIAFAVQRFDVQRTLFPAIGGRCFLASPIQRRGFQKGGKSVPTLP